MYLRTYTALSPWTAFFASIFMHLDGFCTKQSFLHKNSGGMTHAHNSRKLPHKPHETQEPTHTIFTIHTSQEAQTNPAQGKDSLAESAGFICSSVDP